MKLSLETEDITKKHEKRKRRNMESSHQKAAFQWLALQYPKARAVTFHPANGGSRHVKEARNLKSQGVTAGVSDIICLYPSKDYHGFICEFKYGNNDLSEAQTRFLENVKNNGYYICVCYSYFDFIEQFKRYMGNSN